MLTFTALSLICLGIFYTGYYFGNQTGRTAYIRAYLSEARNHREQK